jgi:hypothetical protein
MSAGHRSPGRTFQSGRVAPGRNEDTVAQKIVAHSLAAWAVGTLPNAKEVLRLDFAVGSEGRVQRRSLHLTLTAAQARELANALSRMADATVMGQTPQTPPSTKN